MSTSHSNTIHFCEKSSWAVLLSTLAIYGVYFTAVVMTPLSKDGAPITLFVLFIGAIVAQIIALVISHSFFAVRAAPEPEDERDHLIELKSGRNGAWTLAAGAMLIVLVLIASGTFGAASIVSGNTPGPLAMGNLLLFAFVVSEVVKRISSIVYYRHRV